MVASSSPVKLRSARVGFCSPATLWHRSMTASLPSVTSVTSSSASGYTGKSPSLCSAPIP